MSDIKMSDVFDLPMSCGSSTDELEASCTELGDSNYWLVDFYGNEPLLDVERSNAMATAAAHAINTHDTMQARIMELEAALCEISNMCIGNLTMSYSLDTGHIGQLIYEATGKTNPELNKELKDKS